MPDNYYHKRLVFQDDVVDGEICCRLVLAGTCCGFSLLMTIGNIRLPFFAGGCQTVPVAGSSWSYL
jgi:hypothetical protein